MKRAPSFASTDARLRVVGSARARSASSETPSKRRASSSRLAAAISPSTPTGSTTARLDELVECPNGSPRSDGVPRKPRPFAQSARRAGGEQKGRRIEDHDVLIRPGRLACEQPFEPRRILLHVAAAEDLEGRPFETCILGRDLQLVHLAAGQPDRPRFAVERNLIEPR